MSDNKEKFEELLRAFEVIGEADYSLVEEALAGLEGDDPERYSTIESHFHQSTGWVI